MICAVPHPVSQAVAANEEPVHEYPALSFPVTS